MTQAHIIIGKSKTVSVTKALAAAGNYADNDVLSESATTGTAWTFSAIVPANGGTGAIVKAVVLCETTALTPQLTLFLFSATPTCALNDNVANPAVLHADEANYIGKIDFAALEDLGTGDSDAIRVSGVGNLPLDFECATGDNALYGVVVTRDAITGEAAGEDLIIKLTVRSD